MNNKLQVSLYSPERPLANVSVDQLVIPASEGYMGILPGHTALITMLGSGVLTLEGSNIDENKYFVSGGYVEVIDDKVRVLVDIIERKDEIDASRADASALRAVKRLESKESLQIDIYRALASLERAKARKALKEMK